MNASILTIFKSNSSEILQSDIGLTLYVPFLWFVKTLTIYTEAKMELFFYLPLP